ncbi:hypothetical protein SMICM17S_09753 [Streptomyces microflavus]
MTERWAVSATDGGGALLVGLERDGTPAGPVLAEPDLVEAVRSRPGVSRWVWRSTAELYPRLLAAGVRVERCYDIECAELLLLGHADGWVSPGPRPLRWPGWRTRPCPPDPPARSAEPGAQSSLFEPPSGPGVPFEGLLRVYADQVRRHEAAEHPDRMRLLTASESAGMLVAAEMHRSGLPWRADVHREVLHGLLGERYAGGGEPRRLAELADEVSAAFGRRVRPDLPADVVKAFAQAGIAVKSTRRWELAELDHPAVEPLIAYKKLYRIWTAHGWSWLQDWVREGRFRPEYQPGGTVSGRWTTNGGGALQIPKVIRQAVVADEGWRLVVADADQMEPRVLAAISRDRGLMEVAGHDGDLYKALSDRAFHGDREHAKLACWRRLRPDLRGRAEEPGRPAPPLPARRRLCRRRGAGGRGGADGPDLAGPHQPAGRAGGPGRGGGHPPGGRRGHVRRRAGPGQGPLHPELRGAGQRRRLGPAPPGRAAPHPPRTGAPRGAGLLPARRGDRALRPRRPPP